MIPFQTVQIKMATLEWMDLQTKSVEG